MSRRVFVVVGAKGGVGASFLAVKLCEELPATGARVIVDADLAGKRSLAVLFDIGVDLDVGRGAGMVATARSKAGPLVMELARSYEDGFMHTQDSVVEAIGRLPEDALVVVDAPQPFASTVRPFVTQAAKIIVVTEPTLLGVGAARAMLSALDRFGIPAARIEFVLNEGRAGGGGLRRSEIVAALGTPVSAELPNERDRNFRKTFTTFVETLGEALAATPEIPPIENLRQSTEKPIGDPRKRPRSPEVDKLKAELHAMILTRIDFLTAARADTDAEKLAELRDQVDSLAAEFLAGRSDVPSAEEASRIRLEVIEEALGLGPLETLLQAEDITEIMVNGHGNVFVERRGRLELTTKQFVDDRQVRLIIERIIAPLGRRLDESSPMVDARLPDGSRVNAVIEPVSIDGPTLTIRRFGTKRLGIADLVRLGAITEPVVDFLRAAVEARLNILVSGGTGSGKTTLLNSLSSFIPSTERIVTIEDAAELKLEQPHVVRLESRPPNLEGKGAITIHDLVRNSLRMRPDRIVVGECRGGEALDMLQAMNTGHDGSLTTTHANTPRDALARVETMVLMSGYDLPVRAIREQIAGAIDLVIQVARLRDGSRRVTSVSEIVGMEGTVVTMQELVRYNRHGIDADGKVLGEFENTGVQPNCLERFEEAGVLFDATLFPSRAGSTHAGGMAAVAPFAIIISVLAALALLVTSFWGPLAERAATFGNRFRYDLDLAGMHTEPQQYGLVAIGIGAVVWTLTVIVVRPNPLVAFFLFAVFGALTVYGARRYLQIRRARRIAQFQDELEMALRTLGSSVRVGLGIRQAFVLTAEQNRDPVKTEFTRVVGLSNVGVNLLDAFDQMALRMTNPETAMLARVLRVQAQTGGDLASVLDSLANTIRDRRRIRRRISAITAQGRATSVLLGLLPLALGGFLVVAEPDLRNAMLFTLIGQVLLGAALGLDGIAIYVLMKIVNIDP